MCVRRRGIADRQVDFHFARRRDGSPKELKGALGGRCMVPDEQQQQALQQRIAQVCVQLGARVSTHLNKFNPFGCMRV